MERSESSKGEEAEKGPDNSCSWRKLFRTNAQGQEETRGGGVVGGNRSSERALLCVLWIKRASLCKGALPPAVAL